MVLVLALLAQIGCSAAEREETPVADLVAELAWAEAEGETETIDLGTPEGFAHLQHGWSWAETGPDGATYVWGQGPESAVRFFVSEPRDLVLRFRAWPYPFPDGPPQAVTCVLNGRETGAVDLVGGWNEHHLELPAATLVRGWNALEMHYRRTAEPRRPERRRLSAAFDWIRFEGLADSAPRASEGMADLQMPSGTRVTYYFDSPGPARLELGGARLAGGGRLEVRVLQDDTEERLAATIGADGRAAPDELSIALGNTSGPVRLRLAARGAVSGSPGGVSLTGPVTVVAKAAAQEPPSAATAQPSVPAEPFQRPDILLYLVDTLRADRLEPYGHSRPVSPRIAEFAEESVLFERFFAQAPWTLPATASVMTGLGPLAHGAGAGGAGQGKGTRIPEELTLLPELLHRAGYRTAAFIANGWVSGAYGFDRGFDRFAFDPTQGTTAEQMHRSALEWLDDEAGTSPVFLWVHVIEPHDPYDPPQPFRERFAAGVGDPDLGSSERMKALKSGDVPIRPGLAEDLLDLYDGEIAGHDRAFGEFIDALRARGRYDRSVMMLLADHGEEFAEHGSWTHGHSLHAEMIRVPLLLRLPMGKWGGLRIAALTQQIDVLPTLLELAGIQPAEAHPGRSLLPLVRSRRGGPTPEPSFDDRSIFSFHERRIASVAHGSWKLIQQYFPAGNFRQQSLFDLEADPGETRDLADQMPVTTGLLATSLRREISIQRLLVTPEEARPDSETLRQLKALGYID